MAVIWSLRFWDLRPKQVLSVSASVLNGLEAMRQILQARPTTQVIMLSSYNEDFFIEHARALGAAGYLFKQTSAHLVPQAVREVYRKKAFFNPKQAAITTEP